MKKIIASLLLLFGLAAFATKPAIDYVQPYGKQLCYTPGYHCELIPKGKTWDELWPNYRERSVIMRLNRSNVPLKYRSWAAVPNQLKKTNVMSVSPFPKYIHAPGQRIIIVDQNLQAYGAYNKKGRLLYWGPATDGQNWCPDVGHACHTLTGLFHIFRKQGPNCFSNKFPVGKGGTPMPYCMFWHDGYALHGAEVPGFPSTHGCVGIYNNDARWLNTNFVTANANTGTLILILTW